MTKPTLAVAPGAVPATRTGTTSDAWHGGAQRGYEHGGGLNQILMGARSYLPELGIFTATDPIEGGNTTTYAYPVDPVNGAELDGLANWDDWSVAAKAQANRNLSKTKKMNKKKGSTGKPSFHDGQVWDGLGVSLGAQIVVCPLMCVSATAYSDGRVTVSWGTPGVGASLSGIVEFRKRSVSSSEINHQWCGGGGSSVGGAVCASSDKDWNTFESPWSLALGTGLWGEAS